jgi:HlyD family secretion protein
MPDFTRDPRILRNRRLRRAALAAAAMLMVLAMSVVVARMERAAPGVERATVLIDTVRRGPIVRQVRGIGALVPEDTRLLLAPVEGQVERVLLRPGAVLAPGTVILELSNPQLEQDVLNARLTLASQEAALENLRVQLEYERLERQMQVTAAEGEYELARLEADAHEQLARQDLVSDLSLRQVVRRAQDRADRLELERQRFGTHDVSADTRLRQQQAAVDQARGLADLQSRRLESLRVTAGTAGILQQLDVEIGQRVGTGTTLARITDPTRLKARLRVAETQARDVEVGQPAFVDTRNGVVAGVVSHKDPAAVSGVVTVDITLTDPLPRGAVPDLGVDGTVQLQRVDEVLKMGRPSLGQEHGTIGLFRLTADGHAVRVPVGLGVSSVSEIQVITGLEEGDQVILSDMSMWDAFDRVRLR